MMGSEAVGRLAALIAVAAAVGAQSVAIRSAVAHQDDHANDFGVRLLTTELTAPVSPEDRASLSLTPSSTEPSGVVAPPLAPLEKRRALSVPKKRERSWLELPSPELVRPEPGLDRSLDRRLPKRDSVGSLIELSENDVLIPARLNY